MVHKLELKYFCNIPVVVSIVVESNTEKMTKDLVATLFHQDSLFEKSIIKLFVILVQWEPFMRENLLLIFPKSSGAHPAANNNHNFSVFFNLDIT